MNDKICELEKQIEQMKNELETLRKKVKQEIHIGFENDPIFLLSKEEYEKYKNKIININTEWWLRSPGDNSIRVAYVYDDGSVNNRGCAVDYVNVAVRPAIRWHDIKQYITNWTDNNAVSVFEAFGYNWIVLDDNLAIAKNQIIYTIFDGNSNDYATSSIRKWLHNWLNEHVKKGI